MRSPLYLKARETVDSIVFCLTLALGLWGLMQLVGCNTYEAVTEAPEEVWIHLELIVIAVWCDVLAVLDLFL